MLAVETSVVRLEPFVLDLELKSSVYSRTKIFDLEPGTMCKTKVMLLERSSILDSAHAKPTVSGMRRIESTSSNF